MAFGDLFSILLNNSGVPDPPLWNVIVTVFSLYISSYNTFARLFFASCWLSVIDSMKLQLNI